MSKVSGGPSGKNGHPLTPLLIILALLWGGLLLIRHPEVLHLNWPRPPLREAKLKFPGRLDRARLEERVREPLARLSRPQPPLPSPAIETPALAIILDDFGYRLGDFESVRELRLPVTLAVLPNLPNSRRIAELARAGGYEVLLHLPMEPRTDKNLEKDTIRKGATGKTVTEEVEKALDSIGAVAGVNNHMGSLATTDREVMKDVFSVLQERGLFFIDSVTTSGSVAAEVGKEAGVRVARRDVFLDNENDPEYIKGQLRLLIQKALRNGSAIGIGHARPATFKAVQEIKPEIEAAGITVVTASRLVVQP